MKAFVHCLGLGARLMPRQPIEEALSLRESEGLRLQHGLLAEYSGQAMSAHDPLVQVLGCNANTWEEVAKRGKAAGDWSEARSTASLLC
jgi:hypothetical protein